MSGIPVGDSQSALPCSIQEALTWAAAKLATAQVDSPRLCAELLAGLAFDLSRLELLVRAKDQPGAEAFARFVSLVDRRAAGEPVAYLLGQKEFFSLNFRLTPDVLIPRPETEHIIEEVQRLFAADAALRFADFGTGSGVLAVTLAHEFRAASGLAVDLSGPALELARRNARTHAVEERLEFCCADFTRLALPPGSLDLVVANPPYVTEAEYAELSPEVRDFEPQTALVSPEEGLWHIRMLLPVAWHALRPGGALLCELGSGQGLAALKLAQKECSGAAQALILKDYAGLDRILKVVKSPQSTAGSLQICRSLATEW